MKINSFSRFGCTLGVAAALVVTTVGCAGGGGGVGVLSPTDQIGGRTATQTKVHLAQEYQCSSRGTRVTLPGGDYLPSFRDESGIYYQAPVKILIRPYLLPGVPGPGQVAEGGIYLETNNLKEPKFYSINGPNTPRGELGNLLFANRPIASDLPEDFRYELTKR